MGKYFNSGPRGSPEEIREKVRREMLKVCPPSGEKDYYAYTEDARDFLKMPLEFFRRQRSISDFIQFRIERRGGDTVKMFEDIYRHIIWGRDDEENRSK